MNNPILKLFDDTKLSELMEKIALLDKSISEKNIEIEGLEAYLKRTDIDYSARIDASNDIRSCNIEIGLLKDEIDRLMVQKNKISGFYCVPGHIRNSRLRNCRPVGRGQR